jgi:hypothetical protein
MTLHHWMSGSSHFAGAYCPLLQKFKVLEECLMDLKDEGDVFLQNVWSHVI